MSGQSIAFLFMKANRFSREDEKFSSSVAFANMEWTIQIFSPQYPILHGENIAENPQNKMLGIMHFLNKQLGATGYVARTDNLSVADLAAYATVSTIKVGKLTFRCDETSRTSSLSESKVKLFR